MLGWRILEEGEYKLKLPRLSEDETRAIVAIEQEFKERARSESIENEEKSEQVIRQLIYEYSKRHSLYLEQRQLDYLTDMATLHLYSTGFLERLLQDEQIEEISIIGINKPAYVYIRKKGWLRVNACFSNEKAIMDVVNKLAHSMGRRITLQMPRLDAMLRDGSRLHASLPPLSEGEITIRKFREKPYSPNELCKQQAMNFRTMALLSLIMQSDQSLVIAGNTASGKTTLLNALFSFVPLDERVLITEETPEINIPHEQQVRLVANKEMGIELRHLVYDSLRMRPDRTIVGEVRNKEEAEALFDILHGGQARGTYATFHAQSSSEAQRRLLAFGIDEWKSIDWLLIQKRLLRWKDGKRQEVRRLIELVSPSLGEECISYDMNSDSWIERKSERILEKLGNSLGLSAAEVDAEIEKRAGILEKTRLQFLDCFRSIQKKFYGLSYGNNNTDTD